MKNKSQPKEKKKSDIAITGLMLYAKSLHRMYFQDEVMN